MSLTRLAYRIIHSGSTIALPVDAGDFKLLSRRAIDHILALRESDPYMRGLAVWIGLPQAFVPYERAARGAGRTHFPFFSRNPWKTFALGLTSFSFMPIYACAALAAAGLLVSVAGMVLAVGLLIAGTPVSRNTALVGLLTLFWSTTLVAVSSVGIYVIRIYKDVRGRPQYIVESTLGVAASDSPTPQPRKVGSDVI
jgi:dolichol-phosphate mannosyltransferase